MRAILLCWAACAAMAVAAAPAGAVKLEPIVTSSLTQPVHVAGAPGDDTRLYVVEKGGRIRIVKGSTVESTPFLDVSARVDTASEAGLLSIAFPPDHRATGLFYVFMNVPASPGNDIVIEERRLDAGNPDRADPGYARQTMLIPHRQADNHNGGQLQWGPDGNLWISVGDGGPAYDPENDAQSLANGLGKIHRVTPTPGGGHTIPADNPFPGSSIWAYGLRNPWRFSFDRGTGDLWVGDVGQGGVPPSGGANLDNIEEVSVLRAPARSPGANLGWRRYEGTRDYGSGPPPPGYLPPVIAIDGGSSGWDAVTGGYVVRDPALEWCGEYVYGDLSGPILRTDAANPAATNQSTSLNVPGLVSFGEDWSGRLYAVSIGGEILKFTSDAGTNGPALPADPTWDCAAAPGDIEDGDGEQTTTPPTAPPEQPAPPVAPFSPAPGVFADRTGPALATRIARRQRLRRRALRVGATCDEPCTLTVVGRVAGLTIRPVRRRLAPGVRASIRPRLGPRALAAVRRSRRPTARLVLRAVDAAGNVTRRTARVTIVR